MGANDELMAAAIIGDDAKRFLESELGRVMLGLAQQEVDSAKEQLLTISPSQIDQIRELQLQARFGLKFEEWLTGLASDGEQALAALKQQQQDE